jgi:hypothetical protein
MTPSFFDVRRSSMRSPACVVALGVLAACSNAPLTTSLTAASPAPAPDVFACVRQQIKAIDFTQTSVDLAEQRVTARRYDETQRRSNTQFRRVVDRLEVEAAPSGGATPTTLKVEARTFAEYATQRGPTEEQERTSETANRAAQTLVDRCGGEVVPPAGQS